MGVRYLGHVGLLQLLLVEIDLGFVLAAEVLQRIGQPVLEFTLLPAVDLHQACLVAAFRLTELLRAAG